MFAPTEKSPAITSAIDPDLAAVKRFITDMIAKGAPWPRRFPLIRSRTRVVLSDGANALADYSTFTNDRPRELRSSFGTEQERQTGLPSKHGVRARLPTKPGGAVWAIAACNHASAEAAQSTGSAEVTVSLMGMTVKFALPKEFYRTKDLDESLGAVSFDRERDRPRA